MDLHTTDVDRRIDGSFKLSVTLIFEKKLKFSMLVDSVVITHKEPIPFLPVNEWTYHSATSSYRAIGNLDGGIISSTISLTSARIHQGKPWHCKCLKDIQPSPMYCHHKSLQGQFEQCSKELMKRKKRVWTSCSTSVWARIPVWRSRIGIGIHVFIDLFFSSAGLP